jgi:hypothetical protein
LTPHAARVCFMLFRAFCRDPDSQEAYAPVDHTFIGQPSQPQCCPVVHRHTPIQLGRMPGRSATNANVTSARSHRHNEREHLRRYDMLNHHRGGHARLKRAGVPVCCSLPNAQWGGQVLGLTHPAHWLAQIFCLTG